MTTNPLRKNRAYARCYGYDDLVVPPGPGHERRVHADRRGRLRERARQPRVHRHALRRAGLRRRHASRAETIVLGVTPSSKDPTAASCTCRPPGASRHGEVVLAFERKVQVWKDDVERHGGRRRRSTRSPPSTARRGCPPYDASRGYTALAHLSQPPTPTSRTSTPATSIEHSRGRMVTDEHIALTAMLDNTSQVHCNQFMIDQNPEQVHRRPADHLRRHPVQSLPRHLVPRHRRQRARRRRLHDRPPHRRRSSPATRCSPRPRSASAATTRAAPTSACSRHACAATSSASRRKARRGRRRSRSSTSSASSR